MTRKFIKTFILLSLVACMLNCQGGKESIPDELINTVNGSVSIDKLGITLTHEHVMSNFGKDKSESSVYDETKLFAQVIPYLKELKALGVNSIFDCTTEYFGRRPDLLKIISDSSDVQIITNTGFYGAANDRYVPQFAFDSDAVTISNIWVNEFRNGIKESGIKPGFIKLGFDGGSPSEIDRKLFEAGILTHVSTGLTLAVHTGDNVEAARLQLKLLKEHNVDLSAWIWVHANKVSDDSLLIDFASQDAWISLDGVNESNIDGYVARLRLFKENGLLHKVLLSHDGNGYPNGKPIRAFEAISTHLIPALMSAGFTKEAIATIVTENPKNAFKIKIRSNSLK